MERYVSRRPGLSLKAGGNRPEQGLRSTCLPRARRNPDTRGARHQRPAPPREGPPPQAAQQAPQGPAHHGLDRGGDRRAGRHRRRIPVLQAQRQHQERRHQPGPRHRPAHERRQRLRGHPRPGLGHPLRRQREAGRRHRRRQRPLRHGDDRARVRGPQEGQRGLHTPRHPRRPPLLHRRATATRTTRPPKSCSTPRTPPAAPPAP